MYISYSGDKISNCHYRFWLSYLGKIYSPVPEDRLGSIFGSVTGTLFDDFYTQALWRVKGVRQELHNRVPGLVAKQLEEEVQPNRGRPGGLLRWKGEGEGFNPRGLYEGPHDLVVDIQECIPKALATIKKEVLIGRDARAEVKLDSTIRGHRVGGRADFIMTRAATKDLVILDGKGSRKGGRWVDPNQLKWYGMLYREKFKRIPDKLGFLYWKFEPPFGLEWITFTEGDLDELRDQLITKLDSFEAKISSLNGNNHLPVVREVFKPNLNMENCMFCPYAAEGSESDGICPSGSKFMTELRSEWAAKREDEKANRR